MGYIDYSKEPTSDIAFVDMKSFYASVECVDRGLNPLHTSIDHSGDIRGGDVSIPTNSLSMEINTYPQGKWK